MQATSKKFNILQELEQAIKRKAIDKQKSREHTNKQLLLSIDKRRAENRSAYHKDKSPERRESRKTPSKEQQPYVMKPFILNNENRAEPRRSLGKRLDKLLSLVNYTVTSAEKAIKFVNTANFEAEFAVKLFRSDRDALTLEIESFSQEEAARSPPNLDTLKNSGTGIATLENHSLKNENATLRKQNLLAEAEVSRLKEEKTLLATELKNLKQLLVSEDKKERGRIKDKEREIDNLLKEIHDIDGLKKADKGRESLLKHHLFLKEKELEHLKDLIRPVYPPELENFFQTIEKQTKFNLMLFSNQDNPRKKTELQALLKSLQTQRTSLERKLQPTEQRPMARVTEFRTFLRQKLAPLLDLQTSDLTDVDILEACVRQLQSRQKKGSTKQFGLGALEREVAQLQSEKASLANQLEILKIQNGRDRGDQYKKAIKENDLLKANIEEIYDDLKGICTKCKLLPNLTEDEVDFEKIIDAIRAFTEQRNRQGTFSRQEKRDPQKNMLAIELASEKKTCRQKTKLLEQREMEMTKMQERINELEVDLEKVTRRLEKYDTAGRSDQTKHKQEIKSILSQLDATEKIKAQMSEALRENKKLIKDLEDKLEKKEKKQKGLEETMQQMRKSQDFLKLQIQKLKNQKGGLQETVEDLKGQLTQKSYELSIKTQGFPTEQMQKALSETANQLEKTLKSSQKMSAQLDRARQQMEKYRRDLQQAQRELRSSEQEAIRLGKIIKSQQLQLASHKQSSGQVQPLEQQIHRLKQQLEKQTARVRQQESDLTSLEKDNLQMVQNLSKLEQEKKKLEIEKERWKEEKDRLMEKQTGTSSKEEYVERLEKEMGFLEQETSELKAKIKVLNNSLISERAIRAELQEKLSASQQQIESLKMQAFPPINSSVIQSEVNELKGKLQQTEQDLIQTHQKVSEYENRLKQQIAANEQMQKDFSVLIEKGIKKDSEIAKLQGHVEVLQRKLEDYDQHTNKAAADQNKNQELEQKIQQLQSKLNELEAQKGKLISKYNQILEKNQNIQAELESKTTKEEELQIQIYELRKTVTESPPVKSEIQSINVKQMETLKLHNESLLGQVSSLKQQLNQALIQKLKTDLERVNSIQKQHRHQQGLLRKQIEQLGEKRDELKNMIQDKEKQFAEREAILKKAEQQNTQLKKQQQANIQKQTSLKQQIRNLQGKVSQLTAELGSAQKHDESRISRASEEGILLKNFMMQAQKEKQIQEMKMLNYYNLVKSILKRIVDIDELEDEDLDTLLEKGAQKVFEWKKNRVWDSARKESPDPVSVKPTSEFNFFGKNDLVQPPIKQQPKQAKKQQTPNRLPTQELQTGNLDDFGQYQERSLSDSMISNEQQAMQDLQPAQYGNLIDDFGEHEKKEQPKFVQTEVQQPISEDVKDTSQKPQIQSISQPHHQTAEHKEQEVGLLQDLDDFAEMQQGSLDGSMISQKQALQTHAADHNVDQEEHVAPTPLPIQATVVDDFQNYLTPKNKEKEAEAKSLQNQFAAFAFPQVAIIDNMSDLAHQNEQDSKHKEIATEKAQEKREQKPNQQINGEHNHQKSFGQDQFDDFKDNSMSQSMVSDKGFGEEHHQNKPDEKAHKQPEHEVKADQQNQDLNANLFEDFKDMSMEGSMVFREGSNIHQPELVHIPELQLTETKQSPVAATKPLEQLKQEKHEDNLGMDQFADFQENSMNASMMSQKGVIPGVVAEHAQSMDESQRKEEKKQHNEEKQKSGELGLSQFGDFREESMEGSMLAAITSPQNQNIPGTGKKSIEQALQKQVNKPLEHTGQVHHQPQNLGEDEFADFKDNSLSESMMSNKGLAPEPEHKEEVKQSTNPVVPGHEFDFFNVPSSSKTEHKQDLERHEEQHDENPLPQSKISEQGKKKLTQGSGDAAFQQFASYHNQSMSKSQLKQFDDFPDELERALDSSMLSNHGQHPVVNQGELHNILEGENMQAFEHQPKHFETFLEGQLGGRLSNRSDNSAGSPRHQS